MGQPTGIQTKRKKKLEHEFKEYFEKWGYYCIRSAGSFGIDLIAVKKGCQPLIVNVKWLRKYCGPAERADLIKIADMSDGLPILAYKDIPKGKKNGVRTIEILINEKKRGGRLFLGVLKDSSVEIWNDFLKKIDVPFVLNKKKRQIDLSQVELFSPLVRNLIEKQNCHPQPNQ